MTKHQAKVSQFGELSAARVGLILRVGKFEECVQFYRDTIGLPVWYVKDQLICFRFGTGYLMVEQGGRASASHKSSAESRQILRFDVADVRAAASQLAEHGVDIEVYELDWGTIAAFADPDGNPCELKNADDPYFTNAARHP